MNFLIRLVFIFILYISLSTRNVIGSSFTINLRSKRMSNSQSDKTNFFKHEVRLTTQSGFCTGTIIADRFVLTAAHCVIAKGTGNKINIDKKLMEVTVGITMVNNGSEFPTERLVETIYVPIFFFNTPDTDDNLKNMIGDIAVLKLNYKLGLGVNPRIEALELPMRVYNIDENQNDTIMFTGFGGTKAVFNSIKRDHVPGEFPIYLQYSKAEILPSHECSSLGNAKHKMCAKLVNPGAGICGGDSGGALINLEKKNILGVLSYGSKMCNDALPGKYTRVFPYHSFIISAMNDIPNEMTRRISLERDVRYLKARIQNSYKYHWIYEPNLTNVHKPSPIYSN